jgi:2-hydroxycyclohexanecarboxyl-CoA dehydrogenase
MKLEGKIAVVSGAASGIGRATAEAFAQAGAQVMLADLNAADGETAAAALRAHGHKADFLRVDLTDAASIEAFKGEALARCGRIDVVANVAGWGKTEPFVKNTPEFWRKMIDLNLLGTICLTRAFLDPMIERRTGKIINVASDAGRVGSLGESVYSGTKGGVIAFTRASREMAPSTSVNCVCRATDTPLMAAVPDKLKEAFAHASKCARRSPRRSPTRSCSSPARAPISSPARCFP